MAVTAHRPRRHPALLDRVAARGDTDRGAGDGRGRGSPRGCSPPASGALDLPAERRGRAGADALARMRDEFRFGVSRTARPRSTAWSAGRSATRCRRRCTTRRSRALGLDAVYLPLAAADFDDFRAFAEAFDVARRQRDRAFKVDALRAWPARRSPTAAIGAVNTLRRRLAAGQGRNTDVAGFMAPLAERGTLRGRRATVLGAGGRRAQRRHGAAAAGAQVTIARPARRGRARRWPRAAGVPPAPLAARRRALGPAGQHHAGRHCARRRRRRRWPADRARRRARLRPGLQPAATRACCATPRAARLRHDRRPRDAGRAGGARSSTWWTGRRRPDGVMREAGGSSAALHAELATRT